jgi:hypothetical protein
MSIYIKCIVRSYKKKKFEFIAKCGLLIWNIFCDNAICGLKSKDYTPQIALYFATTQSVVSKVKAILHGFETTDCVDAYCGLHFTRHSLSSSRLVFLYLLSQPVDIYWRSKFFKIHTSLFAKLRVGLKPTQCCCSGSVHMHVCIHNN